MTTSKISSTYKGYKKLSNPVKSLINYLMANGSLFFESSINDSATNYTIASCEPVDGKDNTYKITLSDEEVPTGVMLVSLALNESNESITGAYNVNENKEFEFTYNGNISLENINTDNTSIISVNDLNTTGCIRLSNTDPFSGYDLCIPYCDSSYRKTQQSIKAYTSSKFSPGLTVVSTQPNFNNYKITFSLTKSNNDNSQIVTDATEEDSVEDRLMYITIYDADENKIFETSTVDVDGKTVMYFNNLRGTNIASGETNVSISNYVKFIAPNNNEVLFNFDGHTRIEMTFDNGEDNSENFFSFSNGFYNYKTDISENPDSTTLSLFKLDYNLLNDNREIRIASPVDNFITVPIELKPRKNSANLYIPYNEIAKSLFNEYSNITEIKLERDENSPEAEFPIRTSNFTVVEGYTDAENNVIYKRSDAYYKVNVCPTDGTVESYNTLITELKRAEFTLVKETGVKYMGLALFDDKYRCSDYIRYDCSMILPFSLGVGNLVNSSSLVRSAVSPLIINDPESLRSKIVGIMYLQLCNSEGKIFEPYELKENETSISSEIAIEINEDRQSEENPETASPEDNSNLITYFSIVDIDDSEEVKHGETDYFINEKQVSKPVTIYVTEDGVTSEATVNSYMTYKANSYLSNEWYTSSEYFYDNISSGSGSGDDAGSIPYLDESEYPKEGDHIYDEATNKAITIYVDENSVVVDSRNTLYYSLEMISVKLNKQIQTLYSANEYNSFNDTLESFIVDLDLTPNNGNRYYTSCTDVAVIVNIYIDGISTSVNGEKTYSELGYNGYYTTSSYNSFEGEEPQTINSSDYPSDNDHIYSNCIDVYEPANVVIYVDGNATSVDSNYTYSDLGYTGYYTQSTYSIPDEENEYLLDESSSPANGDHIYSNCTYSPILVTVYVDGNSRQLDSNKTWLENGYDGSEYFTKSTFDSSEEDIPYLDDSDYPSNGDAIYSECVNTYQESQGSGSGSGSGSEMIS